MVELNLDGIPEKEINGKICTVNKWGFGKLMSRQAYLMRLIGKLSPSIKETLSGGDLGDMDVMSVILDSLGVLGDHFNEKEISQFSAMICDGVIFDNLDMSEALNRDSLQLSDFYKIVGFVLEVQFGDFLEMVGLNKILSGFTAVKE